MTEVKIGKTTKKSLNGDVATNYPPLLLSTFDFIATDTDFTSSHYSCYTDDASVTSAAPDLAFGRLLLRIRQGPFSLTHIKELSPFDFGAFLGNMGGFWELLIVVWAILFITVDEQRTPKLKVRDFIKTFQANKIIVKRPRSRSVDSADFPAGARESPDWESAFRGDNSASAPPALPPRGLGSARPVGLPTSAAHTSIRGHPQQNSTSSPHFGNDPSFRRPVVFDVPRRDFSPAGQEPLGDADMSAV
ncbi:unnamed protein product [Ectocarpus sp. 13 AM-2016]